MLPTPSTPDTEPISKQLTIVIGLTVVGFMAFGLALSFYRNILFEKTLEDLEAQNAAIAQQIEEGYRALEYYRSSQYRDKYAKENLGRVNAGEMTIILNRQARTEQLDTVDDILLKEEREAAFEELLRQMPIIEHWKLYLFHREKIEELKRGL